MSRVGLRLPDFDVTYDVRKMRAMVRDLETFLSKVKQGSVVPYGVFSDDTDQAAISTTAAYAMQFNTTDYSNGVAIVGGDQITVSESGVYNIQFSAQLNNTDSLAHDVDIWFQKNGTPEPNSNTVVTVPSSHGGVDGHLVAAWNYVIYLEAGEYMRIYWRTSNIAVTIEHFDAQVSPTRPATPSIILTVTFVSARGA